MKGSKRARRVVVSADGAGVASHAGVGLLREMAEFTGLVDGLTGALIGTYAGGCRCTHRGGCSPMWRWRSLTAPTRCGQIAAPTRCGQIAVLRDLEVLFGAVASMPTAWRVLDRVDEAHLVGVRQALRMITAGSSHRRNT